MRDIYIPKKPPKSKNFYPLKLIKYILIVIVLIVIIYFGIKIANTQIDKWLELEPIDLNKIEKDVQNTPRVSNSIPKSDNKTTITLPAIKQQISNENPPKQNNPPEINKADIKIRILNGNGQPGSARQAKSVLENNGFSILSIGNARNQIYSRTVIYYNESKEQQAELVQGVLKDNDYSVITQQNISLTGQNDLLIVIGNS